LTSKGVGFSDEEGPDFEKRLKKSIIMGSDPLDGRFDFVPLGTL